MREERGTVRGDVVVYEPFTLWGSVGGNVSVIEGGRFYLRGSVYGNLKVEHGGRVHIFGNVAGDLIVERGAKVILSGIVGGHAVNEGGRLFIEPQAKVMGRVKTRDGDTVIEEAKRPTCERDD